MPPISPAQIVALQKTPDQIRNICVLAHVDHGKTSLSDCLISTNGIISPKLAGRVRFLDSRPDEQLRGITMESSAISLFFRLAKRPVEDQAPEITDYLINLIDSPGHIDFSSEVSTASRLCDGAIVLVDAVEGVCSQTVTVLRQAWMEHIKPILVINKLDRLITELQLSPEEAFERLSKLVEQVNAVMGGFFAGERMEEDLRWREKLEERVAAAKANPPAAGEAPGEEDVYEEKDDADIYFAPEKHNVIFASAYDGWAFTIRQFAGLYEKKLGLKREILEKVLWGKYYFDPKTKRVLSEKHLKGRKMKPMFVQLVLNNIWAVYQSTVLEKDQEKVEKIVKSLNLKVPPREMNSKDPRALLSSIFMQWLPLSSAVLVSVVEQLPAPAVAQLNRMPEIIKTAPGSPAVSEEIQNAVTKFTASPTAPVVAYVSKMFSVPESELKRTHRVQLSAEEMREAGRLKRLEAVRKLANIAAQEVPEGEESASLVPTLCELRPEPEEPKQEPEEINEDKEHLIGFARLLSGEIKTGDELYVLGPKYNPQYPDKHISKVTVGELYYIMGRDLESLDSVPAGNVFGIGGLEGKILKNGTLCSLPTGGLNLAGVNLGSAPIVRVALEPQIPSQMAKMVEGLKLLEQADPCALYQQQDNGQHVILTAGELHLERCLKDLRERYAKIEIQYSAPIVPYRETIVSAPEMAPPADNLPRGTVITSTPSKLISLRLRVRPLPPKVTKYLLAHSGSIKSLVSKTSNNDVDDLLDPANPSSYLQLTPASFLEGLKKAFLSAPAKDRDFWAAAIPQITAFGPRRTGPNILLDATGTFAKLFPAEDETAPSASDIADHLHHAFQIAVSAGPMCAEPVQGVCVTLEAITPAEDITDHKPFELIPAFTNAFRPGFLAWSPRIMLAMYTCDIQAYTEVLGKVHDTISLRRGRTISEEQEEGTPFWTIKAVIPVAESFGFADEVRKRTSGAASPQLVFCGFEVLEEDPYWVPRTEEELEDLGEKGERENVALRYVEGVRVRKGMAVRKKLVVGAEKQKTLKR